MATQARPSTPPETPAHTPFVPPAQAPAELTARALILGALLGVVFAASSVYLALKIGLAFTYQFLMSELKVVKEYPGWVSRSYTGASISAEVSPELLGVGYIIGPRIAGYLFSGGCIAYLVLIPAIKLFGAGLTKPIF